MPVPQQLVEPPVDHRTHTLLHIPAQHRPVTSWAAPMRPNHCHQRALYRRELPVST
ncbi:hypothetical protein ACFU90_28230 [Streptomyces noursei]|uniref:hypothetical protein n=1 Tax=Streptomyces noursei TaxID=1971 RepID=UPI0012FEF041|nr:hypothetical protein [Streptomyces noursei]